MLLQLSFLLVRKLIQLPQQGVLQLILYSLVAYLNQYRLQSHQGLLQGANLQYVLSYALLLQVIRQTL